MPKLSVIIPTHNSEEHLREALNCLIDQSNEDFEVILVDCKSTDGTGEIIDEFCKEYVDFYRYDLDSENIYAAMNKGLDLSKGDYVWFYSDDGKVTENTVEVIAQATEMTKADALSGRLWYFGDFEPYFDIYSDTTAVLTRLDKYERSILWDNELSNKVFRRHSLTAKQLKVPENFYQAEGIFNLKACLSGMNIAGCSSFIYQRREQRGIEGFSPKHEPSFENARGFLKKMQEILALITDEIQKDTGNIDGDEAFLQEAIYMLVFVLIDKYYRNFWHQTNESLDFIRESVDKYIDLLTPERLQKLKGAHPDLALPFMVESLEFAAKEPIFSFLLDTADTQGISELLNSLYTQKFPFFEIFVRQSHYDSPEFPQKWKKTLNLHPIDDSGFHQRSRQAQNSRVSISLRSNKPVDPRVLQEVHHMATPLFLKPFIFMQKRHSLDAKRKLKERGMQDRKRREE